MYDGDGTVVKQLSGTWNEAMFCGDGEECIWRIGRWASSGKGDAHVCVCCVCVWCVCVCVCVCVYVCQSVFKIEKDMGMGVCRYLIALKSCH